MLSTYEVVLALQHSKMRLISGVGNWIFSPLFWLNPAQHRALLSLAVRVAQRGRGSTAQTPAGNLSVCPCPLSYSGWVIHHCTLF